MKPIQFHRMAETRAVEIRRSEFTNPAVPEPEAAQLTTTIDVDKQSDGSYRAHWSEARRREAEARRPGPVLGTLYRLKHSGIYL